MSELSSEYWDDRYKRKDSPWDRGKVSPALAHFKPLLKEGDQILLAGCGRGYEVVSLAKEGYQVCALDYSQVILDALGQDLEKEGCLERVDLVQADFFTWEPKVVFDAVYEQTFLCAIDPDLREAYEAKMHTLLKKEGWIQASFKQNKKSDGPPFHCGMDEMKFLFSQERWEWSKEPYLDVYREERRFGEFAVQMKKR